MPTQAQLNAFKKVLQQRFPDERELIRQALLQSDQQSHAELAGRVSDSEEAALADLLVDVSLADIDRHVAEIRAIDAALLRIAQGSYGVCTDCGGTIDTRRLQAAPAAQRCLTCQTDYENRNRTVSSL